MGGLVLSWTTTLVFFPAFGLTLLVFDVAQRVARLFGTRPQEYVAGLLQRTLVRVFALCGTRVALERSPAVRAWTTYIIVSNHQSMFDIALLGAEFFSNFPKYVSKRSLGRWIPSISYNLREGGHILIDRGDAASAVAAIRELGVRAKDGGGSPMIFPEGTRARRGELGTFKQAGLMALLEAAPETPIVPVAIDNSWKLLARNFLPIPWGTRVRMWIGDPIARRPGEDPGALVAEIRNRIDATLSRWRSDAD